MLVAELNLDNVCINVLQLKDVNFSDKYVEIDSFDEDLLFRKYENGQWSEEKFLPTEPEPQEPSTEDKINYIYYKQMGVI